MAQDSKGMEKTEAGSAEIIRIDQGELKDHLSDIVRGTVEETLNAMLDAEADQLCNAQRYERSTDRKDTRAGYYKRKYQTTSGEVELKMPKLRTLPFESAIIERYKRRESSVEEALIEMYLAGVSVRRVEDITQALWGTKVSPGTISNLNQKVYKRIENWRNRAIEGEHPYLYLDGICLKRSWGGEIRNVSILVAVGVDQDGYRQILGVAEGAKEDQASWLAFLRHLIKRGLKPPRLVVSDKCLGLVDSIDSCFPKSKWQRCVVHFYRNVFSVVPKGRVREVAAMLKAIHAQEDRKAATEKIQAVITKLEAMKLKNAAKMLREGAQETLSYYDFPSQHWRSIKTNNPLERLMREIRRRTRVVGNFPDGQSALMLVGARLRHIAGTKWGIRRYMDMDRLNEMETADMTG